MKGAAIALVAAAGVALALSAREAPAPKKLIEFGWDEPDTAFLRQHIRQMERAPFDGCVYHVNLASGASAAWQAFGTRAFGEQELRAGIDDLRATRLRSFRHNFLRMNVTPANLDWYDDFTAVRANARLLARIARAGRSRGIMLDTEQYEGPLFDYARQRDAARRPFGDYAAQARRRGRELMEAFEEGYPGLTVFLTFGHSYALWLSESYFKKPLPEISYGLLPAFVDGLIDGARGARIVDGHEHSYWYEDAERFRAARDAMERGVLPIVGDAERYRRVVSFGFGIWLDYDWRKLGWEVFDVEKNYFTPGELERSVREALRYSDEYVWIYSETPRWWSAEGGPVMLPAAYDAALRRARTASTTRPR